MDRALFGAGVVAAFAVGGWIRAERVLPADFPLNDGGLFLQMVEAVQRAGWALPATVPYNGMEIPFAYPPLAFLVAAALAGVGGVPPLELLRVLPLVGNIATLGAFAVLAATALRPGLGAGIATFTYAVLPGSYVWQLMGGGLTRSLALAFANLGLAEAYLLATRGGRGPAVRLSVLGALTLLTHLEIAWVLALGTLGVLLGFGRRRAAVVGAAAAAVGAAALAAPWWLGVLLRHGPGPFLAAGQTGSLLGTARVEGTGPLGDAALALVFVALLLACAGMVALGDRRTFVVGMLGVLLLGDTRSFPWLSSALLALAIGGFAGQGLERLAGQVRQRRLGATIGAHLKASSDVPGGVRAWAPALAAAGPPASGAALSGQPGGRQASPSHRGGLWGDAAVTGLAVAVVATATLYLNGGRAMGPNVLSAEERAAMAWVAASVPPSARFALVTGDLWMTDRSSEWFPALAGRVSVATPQGTEWLPERAFLRRVGEHAALQRCGARDGDCLIAWAAEAGHPFEYVYLAGRGGPACCAALRAALLADARFVAVYDASGATIFARVEPRRG